MRWLNKGEVCCNPCSNEAEAEGSVQGRPDYRFQQQRKVALKVITEFSNITTMPAYQYWTWHWTEFWSTSDSGLFHWHGTLPILKYHPFPFVNNSFSHTCLLQGDTSRCFLPRFLPPLCTSFLFQKKLTCSNFFCKGNFLWQKQHYEVALYYRRELHQLSHVSVGPSFR